LGTNESTGVSKGFLIILLLVIAAAGGGYWYSQKDVNRLRLDNFTLRGSQSGVAAAEPVTFKRGETLSLVYSMRGATAGPGGNCKVTMSVKVSGPGRVVFMQSLKGPEGTVTADLSNDTPAEYRKNTAITSLEVNAKATVDKEGQYELVVQVRDEVADKNLTKKVPFTVAP